MRKKIVVRILLRVSSNQQLEADGDLSVQRRIIIEYIKKKHPDWIIDSKEYFEGGVSGYSNSVNDRDVLQQALEDALKGEYDVLFLYKDDRLGRRMWEIGVYIMSLKEAGVDVYTVKDGCISPDGNDIMGQIMLALRYGNAQKSSSDTGMRVKDTAKQLVKKGKFMGGKAPYGYEFKVSDQISKHGRMLKQLVIISEQAEVVEYIYELSLHKEYGSARIAKELNADKRLRDMAPKDVWKSGTITSILTNPIYAGYTAYNRRESVKKGDGKVHTRRLDSKEWIVAEKQNPEITIIDPDTWNKVQEKRKQRSDKYIKKLEYKGDVTVIYRNDGMLPLVDVLHCGYCGCKMVNGSKYNYWTVKGTGEKRASKTPIYKCQNAWQGVPHVKIRQYRADKIEPIIFEALAQYVEKLQENEDILEQINKLQNTEKAQREKELKGLEKELEKIRKNLHIMKGYVPDAMSGDFSLSLEDLISYIEMERQKEEEQLDIIKQKRKEIEALAVSAKEWADIRRQIPTWRDVFLNADTAMKRVLVDKVVSRIDIRENEVKIHFQINMDNFLEQSRMSIGYGVPE